MLILFVKIANALANGTHDSRSHLSMNKELFLRKLKVIYCQLGSILLKLIWFKEKWLSLSNGALANHLVQLVLLKVLLDVKDRYRIQQWLLHLHNLRPEHWRLVLLSTVTMVIDAVVIGAFRFVIVSAAAPSEEAAQLALYVMHCTDNYGLFSKSAL